MQGHLQYMTLAVNGRLAAPAFTGFWNMEPDIAEVFGVYQPLYPAAFSLLVRGGRAIRLTGLLFDSVIHLTLVAVIVFALPAVIPGVSVPVAALTGGLCIFLGHYGRPDELAMVLALSGIATFYMALRMEQRWRRRGGIALGGALIGLCGATSIPVTGILGLWALIPWVWYLVHADDRNRFLGASSLLGVVALCVGLAILIPHYRQPGALDQFWAHASGFPLVALRGVVESGDLSRFTKAWVTGWRGNVFQVTLAAILGCMLLIAWIRGWIAKGEPAAYAASSLLIMLLIGLVLPQEGYYYWFVMPAVIALLGQSLIHKPGWLAVAVVISLLVGGQAVRETVRHMCIPLDQRESTVKTAIRELVPIESRIMVDPGTYMLLRDAYPHVHVGWIGCWDVLPEIDYVIFNLRWLDVDESGYRPKPSMIKPSNAAFLRVRFTVLHDWLPTERVSLYGLPLGMTPTGYGVVVLAGMDKQ